MTTPRTERMDENRRRWPMNKSKLTPYAMEEERTRVAAMTDDERKAHELWAIETAMCIVESQPSCDTAFAIHTQVGLALRDAYYRLQNGRALEYTMLDLPAERADV